MTDLPERADLGQLRRLAKELHRAAATGDPQARARISAVSGEVRLSSAQLALAREYGFASWRRLRDEVERRRLIDSGDVDGLRRLMASDPDLARDRVHSCLSAPAASVWNYVGVARFHRMADHDRMGHVARVLLGAGAPVDGLEGDDETPLITAASYGEVGMARALVDAGADLEATGTAIPGGTALAHAVAFGWPEVADLLVEAGAVIHDLVEAAGTGRLDGFSSENASPAEQARALRAAAVNGRTGAIDALLATGLDVNVYAGGATALHWAAWEGNAAGIRHLLSTGADPTLRDDEYEMTALEWCRHRLNEPFGWRDSHRTVETLLIGAGSE